MSNIVILFSAGIDSFLTDDHFKQRRIPVKKLYFDLNSVYTSPEKSLLQSIYDDVEYHSLLNVASIEEENMNVPNRNIMLATMAKSLYPQTDEIYLNEMRDDRGLDSNKDLFSMYSHVLSMSSGYKVEIKSLFWDIEKSEAIKQYMEYGRSKISLITHTFSCFGDNLTRRVPEVSVYESRADDFAYVSTIPLQVPVCMKCKACFRKACALTMGNIYIPFKNMNMVDEYEENIGSLDNYPNRKKSVRNYIKFMRQYGKENFTL